jgi:hypothetical protein
MFYIFVRNVKISSLSVKIEQSDWLRSFSERARFFSSNDTTCFIFLSSELEMKTPNQETCLLPGRLYWAKAKRRRMKKL